MSESNPFPSFPRLQVKKIIQHYKLKRCTDNMFIRFELALSVLHHFCPHHDPRQGYFLFTGYYLMGHPARTPDLYLIQQATLVLRPFRSRTTWENCWQWYQHEAFQTIRLYNYDEEKGVLVRNKNIEWSADNRLKEYRAFLLLDQEKESPRKAFPDGEASWTKRLVNKGNLPQVTFKWVAEDWKMPLTDTSSVSAANPERKIISFSRQELLQAAEKIRSIRPKDPAIKVLQENPVLAVQDNELRKEDEIHLKGCTHIVGMVGAGKTIFLRTSAYLLAERGLRIVILQDTAAHVIEMTRFFRSLSISCSPLIGIRNREKYVQQLLKDGDDFLDADMSRYLDTICLLEGFDLSSDCPDQTPPCHRLHGAKEKKTYYTCPFHDTCSVMRMAREAQQSQIVVTTLAGLVYMRTADRRLFLEHALLDFDVIFADECDAMQTQLDELFTPQVSFNDFLSQRAPSEKAFYEMDNNLLIQDDWAQSQHEIAIRSSQINLRIIQALNDLQGTVKHLFPDTFSSWTVLHTLEPYLPDIVLEELKNLVFHHLGTSELNNLMQLSWSGSRRSYESGVDYNTAISHYMERIQSEVQAEKSIKQAANRKKDYDAWNDKEKREKIEKRLRVLIPLAYFDALLLRINDTLGEAGLLGHGDEPLLNFLRTRFVRQQAFFPSALLGNLFGIRRVHPKDNLLLFRHYALGRTLLTRAPQLRVDKQGNPRGASIVLLSGTSFLPGSWTYHVEAPVDYLLQSAPKIPAFLRNACFIDLAAGNPHRFSGSYDRDDRMEILKQLAMDALPAMVENLQKRTGKILLIVNSYQQAKLIREILCHCPELRDFGGKDSVAALSREAVGESQLILGDLPYFSAHKARILVAPAVLIARGYNIVEESGHASFTSVFFLTRPMTNPNDLEQIQLKLNGKMMHRMRNNPVEDVYQTSKDIRDGAVQEWYHLEKCCSTPLSDIDDPEYRKDVIADLFVLILQIYGRLCRIRDFDREAPYVYFVDGAFHKRTKDGFDTIAALRSYLERECSNPEYGVIMKNLYEPFLTALQMM